MNAELKILKLAAEILKAVAGGSDSIKKMLESFSSKEKKEKQHKLELDKERKAKAALVETNAMLYKLLSEAHAKQKEINIEVVELKAKNVDLKIQNDQFSIWKAGCVCETTKDITIN